MSKPKRSPYIVQTVIRSDREAGIYLVLDEGTGEFVVERRRPSSNSNATEHYELKRTTKWKKAVRKYGKALTKLRALEPLSA